MRAPTPSADAADVTSPRLSPLAVLAAVFLSAFAGGLVVGMAFGVGAGGSYSRGALFLIWTFAAAVGAAVLKPVLRATAGASIRFTAGFLALAAGAVVPLGLGRALAGTVPIELLVLMNLTVSLAVPYFVVQRTATSAVR